MGMGLDIPWVGGQNTMGMGRSSYKTNAIKDESCLALRRNQTNTITRNQNAINI
jgi:hypothetical protein